MMKGRQNHPETKSSAGALPPAAQSRIYIVDGHAFVPVQIAIWVEAVSAEEAKDKARGIFKKNKARCIVSNSQDEGAVFGFEPGEAHEEER